jgi:hypothetical protein
LEQEEIDTNTMGADDDAGQDKQSQPAMDRNW